jgi:peptidoglycan/LPS O-acetylase OafA/YrhL
MDPNREEVPVIRAREIKQAIRTREGLERIRPQFGWTFGVLALILIGFSVLSFYSRVLQDGGLSRLSSPAVWRTLIECCAIFCAGLVYAAAWRTTRNVRPPQRAWGIAASLLSMAMPPYVVYVAHQPMRRSEWAMLCYGAIGLFIYGWPDRWILQALSAENRPTEAPPEL